MKNSEKVLDTIKDILLIVFFVVLLSKATYKPLLSTFLYSKNTNIENYKIQSVHKNTDFNNFLMKDENYIKKAKLNYFNNTVEQMLLLGEVYYLENNCYETTKSGAKLYNHKITGSIQALKTAVYNRNSLLINNSKDFEYKKTNSSLFVDSKLIEIHNLEKQELLYTTIRDELNNTHLPKSILRDIKVFSSPYAVTSTTNENKHLLGSAKFGRTNLKSSITINNPYNVILDFEKQADLPEKRTLLNNDNVFKNQVTQTLYHELGHIFLDKKIYEDTKDMKLIQSSRFNDLDIKIIKEYKSLYNDFNDKEYNSKLSERFSNDFAQAYIDKHSLYKIKTTEELIFQSYTKSKGIQYNKDFEDFIKNYINL